MRRGFGKWSMLHWFYPALEGLALVPLSYLRDWQLCMQAEKHHSTYSMVIELLSFALQHSSMIYLPTPRPH